MKHSLQTTDAVDVLRRANLPDDVRSAANIIIAANRRLRSEIERLERTDEPQAEPYPLPTEPGYYRLVPSSDHPLEVEIASLHDDWWVLFGTDCPLDRDEMTAYIQSVDCTLFPLDLDPVDGSPKHRVTTPPDSDESPSSDDTTAFRTCSNCTRWMYGLCWFVLDSPHAVRGTHSCKEWSDDVLDHPRMDGTQWIAADDVTPDMLSAWPVWEVSQPFTKRRYVLSPELCPHDTESDAMWRPLRLLGMNRRGEIPAPAMTPKHFDRVRRWQWRLDGEWQRMDTPGPGDDREIAWTLHCQGPWSRLGTWRPEVFSRLDTVDDSNPIRDPKDSSPNHGSDDDLALDEALRDLSRSARRLARKIGPVVPNTEGYYAIVYASSEPTRYQGVAQLLAGGRFWRILSSARDFSTSEMKQFLTDNDARLVWLDLDRGTSVAEPEARTVTFVPADDPEPGSEPFSICDTIDKAANDMDQDPSSDRKYADESDEPSFYVPTLPWLDGLRY